MDGLVDAFRTDWPSLVTIPLAAAFVGWITKIVALRMMFAPLEFVGVGKIGWQGMVPKRTAKFASVAADALLGKLIDPRALIDQVDADKLVARLDAQLLELTHEVAREFLARYHPDLWERLPEATRQLVLTRVRARAPELVERLLAEIREDIDTAFDPRYAVVENMVRNRSAMTDMMRGIAEPEFGFMVRMGVIFGFAIGIVQMLLWAGTHNHLVLPLIGGFVGLFSDWVALQMIFVPRRRTRYLGIVSWQGLFFSRRDALARSYANMAADGLLNPTVILTAMMEGPVGDRLFAMIAREADAALQAEEGPAKPVLDLAIGSARYYGLREAIVARARTSMPEMRRHIDQMADSDFELETIIAASLIAMDDDDYEGILRPMFKDDEWIVVVVGGVLGVLLGEVQVQILTHYV